MEFYMLFLSLGGGLLALISFCEVLIYYVVLSWCHWPSLPSSLGGIVSSESVDILILSDPHLLGELRGHWLDKLRREWQMYRSFQTAVSLFSPSAVFILGDVFDEGQWCSNEQCDRYLQTFKSIFDTDIPIYVVAGNHDIGFHYAVRHDRLVKFHRSFSGGDTVQLINISSNPFVLVNSMALEGDGCNFCARAEELLLEINKTFDCAQNKSCSHAKGFSSYVKPVLMQHFPLYRQSDMNCTEPDEAPVWEKHTPMREKLDCISQRSSKLVLDLLNPRAVFAGHTHFGCTTYHKHGELAVPEYTVSSFSWRNTNQPAFLLVKISPADVTVSKCLMPRESTVFLVYEIGVVGLLATLVYYRVRVSCRKTWQRKVKV